MNILVITPVRHIEGVSEILEPLGQIIYQDSPSVEDLQPFLPSAHVIFTNPNKSNIYLGEGVLAAATSLKVICTASTGTNHIDLDYVQGRGIKVIALTEEREIINQISSTSELAFALTLAALRHVPKSFSAVKKGEWDYTKYISRQMNRLTVGVVGFGRLGSIYAGYADAFGSRVLIHDPYKTVENKNWQQVERAQLIAESDIISIHVHVNEETTNMVDDSWFDAMKPKVILVNSARGDIIVEEDAIQFLKRNPEAVLATDVLANEIKSKANSPLIQYALEHENIIITPHIGGMTVEGQSIAYTGAATRLREYLAQN